MQSALKEAVRERLPHRYLEMEERRLNFLLGEWLEYELTRVEFTALETEAERSVTLAGLTFDLRLDRIDRLSDGSLLVIDYKTGVVTPKSWELPRPDDVQLPLYASFAVDEDETLGGLAFAKVRRGDDLGFAGHINDACATLISSLRGTSSLVKNKLDENKDKKLETRDRISCAEFPGRSCRCRPSRISRNLRAMRASDSLPNSRASPADRRG